MSLTIALTTLLLISPTSRGCDVLLANASSADLSLEVEGRHVSLAPGESRHVPLASIKLIEFGAESHEFAAEAVSAPLCPPEGSAELEARSDGQLWLRGVEQQPEGMPLRPVRVDDLTGSPPNNSFKPNPLRGSA